MDSKISFEFNKMTIKSINQIICMIPPPFAYGTRQTMLKIKNIRLFKSLIKYKSSIEITL